MIQQIINNFQGKLREYFPTVAVYLGEQVAVDNTSFFQICLEKIKVETIRSNMYQTNLTIAIVYIAGTSDGKLEDEINVVERLGRYFNQLVVDEKIIRLDSFEKVESEVGLKLLFPLTFIEGREAVEEESKIKELEVNIQNEKK